MLEIKQELFGRAFEKAARVQPAVRLSGAHAFVRRSDGGNAEISFQIRAGAIWASCDCPAGRGRGNAHNNPQPCYHVAAAAIAMNAAKLSAAAAPAQTHCNSCGERALDFAAGICDACRNSINLLFEPASGALRGHDHFCPACEETYRCGCSDDYLNLPCAECDEWQTPK